MKGRPLRLVLMAEIRGALDGVSPAQPLPGLRALRVAVDDAISALEEREQRFIDMLQFDDFVVRQAAKRHPWGSP